MPAMTLIKRSKIGSFYDFLLNKNWEVSVIIFSMTAKKVTWSKFCTNKIRQFKGYYFYRSNTFFTNNYNVAC